MRRIALLQVLFILNRLTKQLSGHKVHKFGGLRRREFSCQSTCHP